MQEEDARPRASTPGKSTSMRARATSAASGGATRRKGSVFACFIGTGNSSKYAIKMCKAFVMTEDRLHLVAAIASEDQRISAQFRLHQMVDPDLAACTSCDVVCREDDQSMFEALALHVARVGADLVILGSSSLCVPAASSGPPGRRDRAVSESSGTSPASPGVPAPQLSAAPGSASPAQRPMSVGSIAIRILSQVSPLAPVLVVKPNSKGAFLSSPVPTSLRCMVDLQANSRHVMEWLFDHLQPDRDSLSLAVAQAYDGNHQVTPLAQRLVTAFSVQASVNHFHEQKKYLLKDHGQRGLPQAVMEDEADILVVQAARCKGLSPQLVELLHAARTSVLVWPADRGGSGARPSLQSF